MYVESGKKALKYMRNYLSIAKEVKGVVRAYWPEARVYVFGSVLKGRYTAASDIDILVVLNEEPDPKEEAEVKASVYMRFDAPIQLHIVSEKKLETWYRRFVDEMIEVT